MIESALKFINLSSPVLITGESGTGKSHLARALFDHSSIHRQCFLTAHLASLKDELFESELFGHKKGSFTGALESRAGYLESVGSGTLFLDEIGELSLLAQKKLLFLLEEKQYVKVGEHRPRNFEGRLIIATNRDLHSLVERGEFREDLYYRLMLFELPLAPLRADRSLLSDKIEQCYEDQKKRYQKKSLVLSSEVKQAWLAHPWSGNYRELKNCCEFAVAMCFDRQVEMRHLPPWFFKGQNNLRSEKLWQGDNYHEALEKFEEIFLKQKLQHFGGRINHSASQMGISKTALLYKCKKYGIDHLAMRAQLSSLKDDYLAA